MFINNVAQCTRDRMSSSMAMDLMALLVASVLIAARLGYVGKGTRLGSVLCAQHQNNVDGDV